MYCSFGERVTVFRKRNKYTKKQLAELTGISSSTLTIYERDQAAPKAEHAIKLALALNVSIDDLISLADGQREDAPDLMNEDFLKRCRELMKHTGNLH